MIDAIIILGMHRSGTSCLTGSLKTCGLNLGSVSDFNKYNQKGNQENPEVFRLNEALLLHNQSAWNKPNKKELEWDESFEKRRDNVLKTYNDLPKPWGFKDPRMLLTYKFWQHSLPNHSLIGSIRHPKAVAMSLAARKNLSVPMESGYNLWKVYNQNLIKIYQERPFPIVNFDAPRSDYINQTESAFEKLGLTVNTSNSFYDQSLKNQTSYSIDNCPSELTNLYQQLLEMV